MSEVKMLTAPETKCTMAGETTRISERSPDLETAETRLPEEIPVKGCCKNF